MLVPYVILQYRSYLVQSYSIDLASYDAKLDW